MRRNATLLILLGLTLSSLNLFAATEDGLTRLENQVRHELVMLPYYGVFDSISFQVNDNSVTLTGKVNRPTLRTGAERVVARIEGVREVVNEIEVLPLSTHDDRLRLGLLRVIYSQPALQKYGLGTNPSIRILVRNGDVWLEGMVLNQMDSHLANILARGVHGVFSVTNNLRVENEKA
ncbi:MAG: BON domain-containing protein [bacterium]|nr:BON domain-containing protein [bacterium]